MTARQSGTDAISQAILLMVAAAALATGLSASAKWLLTEAALPALQVVTLRYAVHFLLALALFVPRQGPQVFRSKAPGRLLLRSGFLIAGTVLNFLALKSLPLTLTTVILFSGPILISFLAVPMLGEPWNSRRLVAILVGLLGVLIVVQPGRTDFDPAIFFSIGAVVAASLYYIMTRMLAGVDSNASIQLWSSGLAVFAFAPFSLATWTWPETALGVAVMIAMGLFGGLSHVASTQAHQMAPASTLAPFVYAQILTAVIVGALVFSEQPAPATILGCVVIILSGLFLWRMDRRGNAIT